MAQCPPALLDDIADVLADLRGWPGIVEKSLWNRAAAAFRVCGIGSCGVPRPSLDGCVTGTRATRRVPTAGGR